ncbi:putative MATE family efflux protein [Breznakia sp. PH1-1]|nr:putative MATE family efflux protein [Breznakia sp. PH1-1]MDH6404122.1 putative MATE family efflux protein [Breznakia sp. PF1-11]MDH6411831.1 putative MATE family efflux protein [Breznakia sp. PFB1-11]MDH6414110.1 putative MATE family efflux protein [Breznakia sp. PFB1-14]MDH6416533.1 putative MATE family efflux protein [Breznakia sp. PFB1-4]MDH6418856.1 putative MATE family efflux protein [Breznakia sp. PFB1-12]MDH6473887.1 putative MATE family efflux protein [Breznakia sp. PFB2-30]MDH647
MGKDFIGGKLMSGRSDMTTGKPMRIIVAFTMPIFLGGLFQQFYNLADTLIVGQFVGHEALAAVGSCGTLVFLIIGFLMGLTSGFGVVVANFFGAKNHEEIKKSFAMACIISIVVSVILTFVSIYFLDGILELMNTPQDMYQDAYGYMYIICLGIVWQVLYNLLAGLLRAIGDSKRPLYFLVLAAVLNVVLDLVFIIVFKMRADGAALATVISQGVSGLLCLYYILKKVPEFHTRKNHWQINGYLIRRELAIGLPMALQFSITAIGTIVVQSALNTLGSIPAAGFAAAVKIEQVATQMLASIGTTMATYCAQNMGASRLDRIKEGFKAANFFGITYSVVIGIVVIFFGKYVTYLFVSNHVDRIIGYVDTYMMYVGLTFVPLHIILSYRSGIQGMGFGFLPMFAGVVELLARIVVGFIGAGMKSYDVICLASPAAWITAALFLLIIYRYIMNRYSKNNNQWV